MTTSKERSTRRSSLVLVFVLGLLTIFGGAVPQPVGRVDSLFGYLIILPVVAVLIIMLFPFLLNRRGSDWVVGFFLNLSTVFISLLLLAFVCDYVNMRFDRGDPKYEAVLVKTKYQLTRGSRVHQMRCALLQNSNPVVITVSRDFYEKTQVGDRFVVAVRRGALGLEWISSYSR